MTNHRPEARADEIIGQRYQLLRPLREEPWGEVWLARDRLLGAEVGLKLLTREAPEWEAASAIFEQEAVLALRLRHPQILGVYHLERAEDFLYLVSEPFPGESLLAQLARHQRLGAPQALNLLEAISQALAYAHQLRLVHRSLNPLNVLRDGEEVRLANFAFPRVNGEGAIYLELKAYDPPEFLQGDALTPAGNVFSLGVLGFRLLAGSLPYPLTFDEPFPYRLEIPPADLAEIPIPLQNVLLRSLAEDPEERFPQAGAFLAQLRQARELLRPGHRERPGAWKPAKPRRARPTAAQAREVWDKFRSAAAPRAQQVREQAGTAWQALKKAPRRLWWGLGLAALLLAVAVVGLKASRQPPAPSSVNVVVAPPSHPPLGGGPPLVEREEGLPSAPAAPGKPQLAPAAPPVAPAPAETAKPAKEDRYMLVVATYASQKQAQTLQQRLKDRNYRAITVSSQTGGKSLYQVQVGPITGVKAAEDLAGRIKAQEQLTPRLKKLAAKPAKPAKTPNSPKSRRPT